MKHFLKIAFFVVLIFCIPSFAFAANRYWVGGDGDWSDNTNHWSASSGGAPGASRPGNGDRAIFDDKSGGGTCTVNQNVSVRGLYLATGNTTTLSQGSRSISVGNQDFVVEAGVFQGGSDTITCSDRFTVSGGTFNAGTNRLRVTNNCTIDGGTFVGSTGEIDLNGRFDLDSGSFTASSGTMYCGDTFTISGGSFIHNSGTVIFDTSSFTITPLTEEFHNVTFDRNNTTFTVASGQTLVVNGALTLTDGRISGSVSAKGDISCGSGWDGGDGTITANGSSDQTLTGAGSAGDFLEFVIDKPSGTLYMANTIRTYYDWTYTQGTVDAGTSTVEFYDTLTISSGSMEFYNVNFNRGSETFTVNGTMIVSGTATFTNGVVDGGTIEAKGNVVVESGADGGSATLKLTGTGSQTITGNNNGDFLQNTEIEKPSGTATITGTCNPIYNLTVKDGTLDFTGGYQYSFRRSYTMTVESGATLLMTGSSGSMVTFRRQSGSGTYWFLHVKDGASYTADYVDVSYSNASPGDQYIYATNSTDSGNNIDWYFIERIVFTTLEQTLAPNEVSGIMTIELQDADGNAVNVPEDITIDLETTSAGGSFSLDGITFGIIDVTIPTGASQASFYYKDSHAGNPIITCSENPSRSWTDGMQTETITSDLASFTVEASSPQISGTPFDVTVTAKDSSGGTMTSYAGGATLTVNYISPATGTEVLEGDTVIANFTDGVAVTSVHYDDAGTITITATDDQGLGITGTSSDIIVRPHSFEVTPNSTTQEAGTSFTLTISAKNSNGETTPNYSGTVTVSVNYVSPNTGTETITHSSISPASFTNGVAQIADVSYPDCGTITIMAQDSTYVAGITITGTSGNILFRPARFSITLSEIPKSRSFYYINEPFDVAVTAENSSGNKTPNYRGTISIKNASMLDLYSTYTFVADDSGEHIFKNIYGREETSFVVEVSDSIYPQATGKSNVIDIKYGEIAILAASGPVGSVSVDVKIRDKSGDVIASDDSTVFTVKLEEFIANNSATSTATYSPVTVTNGIAEIIMNDSEAETVAVTPLPIPELTPIPGTVRFGTVSGSGVGVELWREIREPSEYEE